MTCTERHLYSQFHQIIPAVEVYERAKNALIKLLIREYILLGEPFAYSM